MAYCSVDDVKVYISKDITLTDESDPTKSKVEQMCIDVSENVIDPIIKVYITLPVTDSQGLDFLKEWAITCVLLRIYRLIMETINLQEQYKLECEAYKDMFLENPKIVSPEARMKKEEIGVDSFTMKSSIRSNIRWEKNKIQW